jgi:ABC-type multidrug transport system permease subunit
MIALMIPNFMINLYWVVPSIVFILPNTQIVNGIKKRNIVRNRIAGVVGSIGTLNLFFARYKRA